MEFRSAVDRWFVALALVLPALVLAYVAVVVDFAHGATVIVIAAAALVALGLPVWLMLSTVYRVDGGALTIRSGPFRWRIPLKDIETVQPSRSLLSSPALSIRRLEIRYAGRRRILVSPAEPERFLRALGVHH